MDLHFRSSRFLRRLAWPLAWSIANSYAILLSAHPAEAQLGGDLLLDDVFLQNAQRPEGAKFQIDLPDGTRCMSHNGTPPTISLFGGATGREDEYQQATNGELNTATNINLSNGLGGGYAAGAIVTVPFGANTHRNCDEAYNLHIASQKLELAQILFDQGVLSEEELNTLVTKIKSLVIANTD